MVRCVREQLRFDGAEELLGTRFDVDEEEATLDKWTAAFDTMREWAGADLEARCEDRTHGLLLAAAAAAAARRLLLLLCC